MNHRRHLAGAAFVFAGMGCALAQAPEPAFEVASIRPATFRDPNYQAGFYAGASGGGECQARPVTMSGTLVSLAQQSLCSLVVFAYNVKGFQVLGAPSLPHAGSTQDAAALVASHPSFFYDIEARAPGGNSVSEDQARAMVRTLLADRFGLRIHHETREMPYYALTLGKRGAKLAAAKADCHASRSGSGLDAMMHSCGISIQQVINGMNGAVDKPVVDATGLTGTFDYDMRAHMPEDTVALYEQFLGLTLESRKGPIDVIVVDHVEALSAN